MTDSGGFQIYYLCDNSIKDDWFDGLPFPQICHSDRANVVSDEESTGCTTQSRKLPSTLLEILTSLLTDLGSIIPTERATSDEESTVRTSQSKLNPYYLLEILTSFAYAHSSG